MPIISENLPNMKRTKTTISIFEKRKEHVEF